MDAPFFRAPQGAEKRGIRELFRQKQLEGAGLDALQGYRLQAGLLDLNYCSSLVTSCCRLLAWASAEMPVWLRISYLERFDVADA